MSLRETWRRWMGNTEAHSIDKMSLWGKGEDIGDPVHAGVFVSQTSALKLTVVWRCIRLISETIAALPAEAVRKRGPVREPVERPAPWFKEPNPDSTWFEFLERALESLLMDGNAFVFIGERDALGFATELWVLRPDMIEVKSSGVGTSFVWNGDVPLTKFGPTNPTGDILHIKLATAGAGRGMSPIEAARQAIGLGLVTEKFGANFFGRGQQMSGVIQLPAPDQGGAARSKEYIDLMRETWHATHSGSDNSHKPAILTGGATWAGISIAPEDAQFLETRKFQVEDIARIYGVPAHLIGLEEKDTSWGTGIEAQTTGFLRFVLLPHIVRLETAFSQLLPNAQFMNLDTKAFLRGDKATEANVLQTEVQNGVISFNDWRAILDMPPRPGGERFMVPSNMKLLEANGLAAPPPPTLVAPQPPQEEPA